MAAASVTRSASASLEGLGRALEVGAHVKYLQPTSEAAYRLRSALGIPFEMSGAQHGHVFGQRYSHTSNRDSSSPGLRLTDYVCGPNYGLRVVLATKLLADKDTAQSLRDKFLKHYGPTEPDIVKESVFYKPPKPQRRTFGHPLRAAAIEDFRALSRISPPASVAARARAASTVNTTSDKTAGLRRPRRAPIQLTEKAVARIRELLADHQDSVAGVRLGVKRRGCNGLSYTMNYAKEKPKFDEEVDEQGIKVFIDPMALMSIVGTVMDYEETELTREFTFSNPNAKGKCGCGESFNV